MIMTCHMRQIFMPINQTNEKLFISCNNLLNVTYQSHSTKDGCYKPNENCLIVATINPISHSCPVHHGTIFKALIDKFIVCKCREITFFAHNYLKTKHKQTKTLSSITIEYIFSISKRRLGI